MLLETGRDFLGDRAKKLYDDVLAIFRDPTSDAPWHQYFDDFPKKFSDFCALFCRHDQRELTKGCTIFMEMLGDYIKEQPQVAAGFLLGLAKDTSGGPGDELAVYGLNYILVAFICDSYGPFLSEFNKMGKADQDNIINFVCYAEGTCFSIFKSDGSCCITNKLKEKKNTELLNRFRKAAGKFQKTTNS
jgi:hypothetical protein